ncbi:MAG: cyanophycin synthetase [Candidatus Latescibacterota bacterium]
MDYFRGKRFLDTLPDWEAGRPAAGPLEHYLPRARALLRRLGDPHLRFRRAIVGGTNGKGTVSSLAASLLQAAGCRVGLYTSPHLHTQRERIRIGGELTSKDQWAEGLGLLYDRTRDFEAEGYGAFTKFEAITALAAHLFAGEGVEIAVFEVGLGGRYDATNAWDSEAAVLTSIGLDHVEVLGSDLAGIAADKVQIARPGCPLFTGAGQDPAVLERLRQESLERGVHLYLAGPSGVRQPDGCLRPYPLALDGLPGRPRTYLENARLALGLAGHLLGEGLDADLARRVVADHRWPGRFETASERPLVMLDGAHNPAGAAALAEDLAQIAPRWTVVVGAGRGHDAAGILRALRPVARRLLLTASDHPRAQSAAELAAQVPADLPAETVPCARAAFARAVANGISGEPLCITGSLYLVAQARDFFHLPGERDGITEDVALESLQCLELACQGLGLTLERVSADGNVARVHLGSRNVHFLRNKNPFNDYVAGRLAEDKGYQHELFVQAGLPVPATLQVFNPLADARFDRYKTHPTLQAAVAEVEACFGYPLVVKKYRSSLAQGVFLEHNGQALCRRLQALFENAGFLDNIVLVQEYVQGPEYRIVATQGELLLAYAKVSDQVETGQDLNPLHQADGRAVRVEEDALLARLRRLTEQVAQVVDLGFYAIDLIDTRDGFRILELNPNPFCYFYNRSNGRQDFVGIYERLLRKYVVGGARSRPGRAMRRAAVGRR